MAVHVGDRGTTETPLHLTGSVRIGATRHIARSDCGPMETGTAVVVVGDDMGGLVVRPIEVGHENDRLPDHGRAVFATPAERAAAAQAQHEARTARDWAAHRRTGISTCTVAGALAAGAMMWWLGELDTAVGVTSWLLAGAAWGAGLFLLTDTALGRFEEGYRRLAAASGTVGATGAAFAAALAVPALGLGGLAVAALVSILCAAVLPGVLILCAA